MKNDPVNIIYKSQYFPALNKRALRLLHRIRRNVLVGKKRNAIMKFSKIPHTHTEFKGGGVSHLIEFGNTISREQLTQKVHPVGRLFGWVLRPHFRNSIFGPMQGPKNQKWQIRPKTGMSHYLSIDNSRPSYHEKFQSDWSKNG